MIASLVAGAGFGFFFVAIGSADHDSGMWPLVAARLVGTTIVGILWAIRRVGRPAQRCGAARNRSRDARGCGERPPDHRHPGRAPEPHRSDQRALPGVHRRHGPGLPEGADGEAPAVRAGARRGGRRHRGGGVLDGPVGPPRSGRGPRTIPPGPGSGATPRRRSRSRRRACPGCRASPPRTSPVVGFTQAARADTPKAIEPTRFSIATDQPRSRGRHVNQGRSTSANASALATRKAIEPREVRRPHPSSASLASRCGRQRRPGADVEHDRAGELHHAGPPLRPIGASAPDAATAPAAPRVLRRAGSPPADNRTCRSAALVKKIDPTK